ncbi:hypothetical protein AB0395_26410 [Streptosporangium sp. NPDC051023]|uniref:hypothetical protein n=1 Tax=Streptosporangium sp. NPDC051023 TaxID=3155410 RepID=UPI00344B6688
MTSIKVERLGAPWVPENSPHAVLQVYAGPDAEHRAHSGTLTMTHEEAAELIARIDAGEAS